MVLSVAYQNKNGSKSLRAKTWMIMKITIILMLFFTLNVSAKTHAQRVTIVRTDVSLGQVFKDIELQTGFHFFYDRDLIQNKDRINVKLKDVTLDEALTTCLKDQHLDYTIVNNTVVIRNEPNSNSWLQDATTISAMQVPATEIHGRVVDPRGLPLQNVSVILSGTKTGTTTDANGLFTITSPSNTDIVLEFSSVGYQTQKIAVKNDQKELQVTLQLSITGLNDIVVVGFGTQKKVDITGAVQSLSSKDIPNVPVTQASQLLTGLVSGVNFKQTSSQPGKDNAAITIRGLGTFSGAGTSPLIIVDGVASNLDEINPNDIASVSVLKDAASASIYGARAANGVILIETKKGQKGKLRINYNAYMGLQQPSEKRTFVDSWVYAQMINEALTNDGQSKQYTDEDIAKFKLGTDPMYPNKNHYNDLINSGNGLQSNHYLSLSGGNSTNQYMLSFGYLDQNGLVDRSYFKRYNLRLNFDNKLDEKLSLHTQISGNNSIQNEPTTPGNEPVTGIEGLIDYSIKIPNTTPGKLPDGTYGNFTGFTTEGWMDSHSFDKIVSNNFIGNIRLDWDVLKSLKISGVGGYNFEIDNEDNYRALLVVDQTLTEGPANLTTTKANNSLLTLQALVNYDFAFKENNFHFLGGYSEEGSKSENLQGYRENFPNNSLYELNAGSQTNMQSYGTGSQWGLRSFFSRLNYNYQDKYLFEANARYDGSSRFPQGNKYGFFPSASAGWRISQERFFKDKVDWISDLKLRGSWGKLGNQNIGNYPYQQVLSLGVNYPLGGSNQILTPGAAALTLPNPEIHWETTRVTDIGVDVSVLDHRLNVSVDYFNKLTTGILYNTTVSDVLGLTPSVQNAGTVSNKGIDINIQNHNSFGDFSYSIALNASYTKNEVLALANVKQDIAKGLFVGSSLESIYGYVTDGVFVDESDIQKSAKQPYNEKPGDIKFVDISGPDGVPDGKVDAQYDRKIIGNRFPKYNYGGNLNIGYKSVNLSIQFDGIAGVKNTISGYEGNAFELGSNPQKWMINNRWDPNNPTANAKYPRLGITNGSQPQFATSTYRLWNASYLRLNNVQLGYTLPSSITNKWKVDRVHLYVGARNLFNFDHYYPGWDPEITTNYPPTRLFVFGINLSL